MNRALFIVFVIFAVIVSACAPPVGPENPDQSATAPTEGLLAYYPFSGNANDASGNGSHGTPSNVTLATDRNGDPNAAYLFNGTDSEIIIAAPDPAPADLDDWAPNRPSSGLTLSAWVELDGVPNTAFTFSPILMKSAASGSGANSFMYRMLICSGRDSVSIAIGDWNTSSAASSLTFEADPGTVVWYHVASTWDGTTARFYLNGALVGENDFTPTMPQDNLDLVIGADYPGAYESFNGRIDEVRIYDRALTLEEIRILAEVD